MPQSIEFRDRIDLVRREDPPGEVTIRQDLGKGYRRVGLPRAVKAHERRPELAGRLGQGRDVELVRPDPGRLLDVLVVLPQRDPVLVLLREPEDALGVL